MGDAYFVTHDLESTAVPIGLNKDNIGKLDETRERMRRILLKSLNKNPVQEIHYSTALDFFEDSLRGSSYLISADGGVYIKNPDMDFQTTRLYDNKDAVLEKPKSYEVRMRDGRPLESQGNYIPRGVACADICDDGIFSGDTIGEILKRLDYGSETSFRINVLLNFSGTSELSNGSKINALYNGGCLDWVDERDFFYGVEKSGASIRYNGSISGVPYISHPDLAHRKAGIPSLLSQDFCISMIDINIDLWKAINPNACLGEIGRLNYLKEQYPEGENIIEILYREKKRIQSL